jgi:hypothetical protein
MRASAGCLPVAARRPDVLSFRWTALLAGWAAMAGCSLASLQAAELRGQLDVGLAAASDAVHSFDGGLGKSPYAGAGPVARLALRGDAPLSDTLVGRIVIDADSQRSNTVGIQEAWLGWHPIPTNPWRIRLKAGSYFPASSLETGYDSATWAAERTFSASAVNTWIGQEIRINGVELDLLRRGVFAGSPHTFGVTAGVFTGNDPAGTLLAWQGWNLSGGITGIGQHSPLPDLPAYRPDGPIPIQTRDAHLFREIDGRLGRYVAGHYGHAGRLEVSVLHYDNRADPLRIAGRQYGWRTRFDHASLRLRLPGNWELRAQGLWGETLMGPAAVQVDFAAWYVLATHAIGEASISLRYDDFGSTDRDLTPADPNGEQGRALALAYARPLTGSLTLITELLGVDGTRPARQLLDEAPRQREASVAMILRWTF